MRKRICIISYSPIKHDARVLRQIEYLAPHYDVMVIGHGEQPDIPGVKWRLFPYRDTLLSKVIRNGLQIVGRAIPAAYDLLEISRERYWKTIRLIAAEGGAHAFLADDLTALSVAAHAARRYGAKLVFDAHEYSPLEQETPKFKRLETPYRTYLLRKYAKRADTTMTVCAPIAERYTHEFGFHPQVVMNAPKMGNAPDHPIAADRIRLVNHGMLQPERRTEAMIAALGLTESRFELHFVLMGSAEYLERLKRMGEEIAPGRVFFHDPLPAVEIVPHIAQYDLGIFMLPPTTYNFDVALPNKFFDFISAGLGVVIGPSPSMAQIAQEHGFGCVAPSFEPEAVANLLNSLTVEQIMIMRANAREAASTLNADVEMAKVVRIFDDLFSETDSSRD